MHVIIYSLDITCARLSVIINFITFLCHTTPLFCQISKRVTWYFSILYLQQEREKMKIVLVNYLWILLFFKAYFDKVPTMLKNYTAAYSSIVAKFLNFVVKFFLVCLVFMMENWSKNTSFFIAVCINEKRKKNCQYPLLTVRLHSIELSWNFQEPIKCFKFNIFPWISIISLFYMFELQKQDQKPVFVCIPSVPWTD